MVLSFAFEKFVNYVVPLLPLPPLSTTANLELASLPPYDMYSFNDDAEFVPLHSPAFKPPLIWSPFANILSDLPDSISLGSIKSVSSEHYRTKVHELLILRHLFQSRDFLVKAANLELEFFRATSAWVYRFLLNFKEFYELINHQVIPADFRVPFCLKKGSDGHIDLAIQFLFLDTLSYSIDHPMFALAKLITSALQVLKVDLWFWLHIKSFHETFKHFETQFPVGFFRDICNYLRQPHFHRISYSHKPILCQFIKSFLARVCTVKARCKGMVFKPFEFSHSYDFLAFKLFEHPEGRNIPFGLFYYSMTTSIRVGIGMQLRNLDRLFKPFEDANLLIPCDVTTDHLVRYVAACVTVPMLENLIVQLIYGDPIFSNWHNLLASNLYRPLFDVVHDAQKDEKLTLLVNRKNGTDSLLKLCLSFMADFKQNSYSSMRDVLYAYVVATILNVNRKEFNDMLCKAARFMQSPRRSSADIKKFRMGKKLYINDMMSSLFDTNIIMARSYAETMKVLSLNQNIFKRAEKLVLFKVQNDNCTITKFLDAFIMIYDEDTSPHGRFGNP